MLGNHFFVLMLEKTKTLSSSELLILSDSEKQEISRLVGSRKNEYLLSRFYFRRWLSQILKTPPETVPLEKRDSGKLFLNSLDHFISLSHSKNFLALSLGPEEHGIDIEEISERPQLDKIRARYFDHDQAPLVGITPLEGFFLKWSLLEAHSKCLEKPILSLLPYKQEIPKFNEPFMTSSGLLAQVCIPRPQLSFALVSKNKSKRLEISPIFLNEASLGSF